MAALWGRALLACLPAGWSGPEPRQQRTRPPRSQSPFAVFDVVVRSYPLLRWLDPDGASPARVLVHTSRLRPGDLTRRSTTDRPAFRSRLPQPHSRTRIHSRMPLLPARRPERRVPRRCMPRTAPTFSSPHRPRLLQNPRPAPLARWVTQPQYPESGDLPAWRHLPVREALRYSEFSSLLRFSLVVTFPLVLVILKCIMAVHRTPNEQEHGGAPGNRRCHNRRPNAPSASQFLQPAAPTLDPIFHRCDFGRFAGGRRRGGVRTWTDSKRDSVCQRKER